MKAWSVAVGNIDPLKKASRDAVKYISKLNGFLGFFPHYPHGTLCLFKTENDAKRGRNRMDSKGIQTGCNICALEIGSDENEKPVCKGDC